MARSKAMTTKTNPEMRTTPQADPRGPHPHPPSAVLVPTELWTRCQVSSRIQTTDVHIIVEGLPYQARHEHLLPLEGRIVMVVV
jgi:hypothetical protein